MSGIRRFSVLLAGASLAISSAWAQNVISAKSGLIHYVEGDVFVADKAVEVKPSAQFPELKEGQILRTDAGRAELLLGPGVFLRVSEQSSIKMITNRLVDTRIELVEGSVLVESAEVEKDTKLTFVLKNSTIEFAKRGLVRLDADTNAVKVYQGEATIIADGQTIAVKESRMATVTSAVITPEKFDNKVGDAFYRWAARRANSLALASVSAARSIADRGMPYRVNSWMWNPYLGTFTYLPFSGAYFSPFGYRFYSPRSVVETVYVQPPPSAIGMDSRPSFNSSLGYNTAPRSSPSFSPSGGGGGGGSAPAAAAASPRSGDSGGARDSGGRGR